MLYGKIGKEYVENGHHRSNGHQRQDIRNNPVIPPIDRNPEQEDEGKKRYPLIPTKRTGRVPQNFSIKNADAKSDQGKKPSNI